MCPFLAQVASCNVPTGRSRGAKESEAFFKARLSLFFAVAFFLEKFILIEKIGRIH